MNRSVKFCALGLAAGLTLSAGQIQLGGVNGLTTAYINPGVGYATSCAGGTGCYNPATYSNPTGTRVTATGGAYRDLLFQTAQTVGPVYASASVPATPAGGGATFARINDSGNPTANFIAAAAPNNATNSTDIVVPVGLFGVDKIWTMMNDFWGANGAKNTTVVFNFSSSSDGTSGVTSETVALKNGELIRASVDSDGAAAKTCLVSYNNTLPAGAGGNCPAGSLGTAIATGLTAGGVVPFDDPTSNAFVSTGTTMSPVAYTSAPGITGAKQYAGTTGFVNLDYQLFDFGFLHTSEYLVSIIIKNQIDPLFNSYGIAGATGTATTSTNQTRLALSAITVNQVPEPSTIILSLAGLGALGYFRRRKV